MHCMISGRMLVSSCPHSGGYWLKIPSSLSKDQKVFRMISIDEEFSGITPSPNGCATMQADILKDQPRS